MMKKWIMSSALIFAAAGARADSADAPITVSGEWKMSLSAEGKITALNLKPGRIKEVLRDALEKTIRTWAFEPGKENGIPAATDTTLIVEMNIARKADDAGPSVVLVRAFTGGAIRKIGAMPAFSWSQSQSMKKDKKEKHLVVLRVTYDKLGVPEEIAIAEGSPITKGVLVDAAIKAVKTWAFDPERVAGHGLRAAALVPICYQNEATDESYEECEWSPPNGDGSFIGRGSIALDSSVHLKTEVAGFAL